MTTRYETLRKRRQRRPAAESDYATRMRYLCARLLRTPEGQEFLDLLGERYVLKPSNEAASESALRADAAVRNLVLQLEQFTHEGPLHAARGDPSSSRTSGTGNTGTGGGATG